jgi:beta-1,4-mannosyltransferase
VRRRSRSGPRVLYSFDARNVEDNEYLASVLPEGAAGSFRYFSWGFAAFGNYEVFHLHWPELLLHGRSRLVRLRNLVLLGVLIGRLTVTRTPVVRTVHNLRPHEAVGRSLRWAEALLRRVTSVDVFINESDENDYGRGVVILHSSYPARRLAPPPERASAPLVFFGMLRPYKGITELVAAHGSLEQAEGRRPPLVIAGAAADRDYVVGLQSMISARADVELFPEFLTKDRLEQLITSASMVVLPYTGLYNSGAVLHALSCGRPVLVPATQATSALEREFGSWIQTFTPPLQSRDLAAPELHAADLQSLVHALERRSPETVRHLHALVYRAMAKSSWATRRPAALRRSLRASSESLTELVAHSARNEEFFSGSSR